VSQIWAILISEVWKVGNCVILVMESKKIGPHIKWKIMQANSLFLKKPMLFDHNVKHMSTHRNQHKILRFLKNWFLEQNIFCGVIWPFFEKSE
jgi:hypothetical protein